MNNLSKILIPLRWDNPVAYAHRTDMVDHCGYFFRGAPYGAMLFVVWELSKPLQYPCTSVNLTNIT